MLRLKAERLRRGWSQTALAFHAGMSVADISRIETRRMWPYDSQLLKLATALGVETEALLGDVDCHDGRSQPKAGAA